MKTDVLYVYFSIHQLSLLSKTKQLIMSKPVIGITTCCEKQGMFIYHQTGDKYISAIVNVIDGLPLLIPSIGNHLDIDQLLDKIDGLLLTGSYSNVEPHHYNGSESKPDTKHDPRRDSTTLPLIRKTIEKGVPLLAICRGFQELNVAYEGSLHQEVHEIDGHDDHRENKDLDLEGQYGFSHKVKIHKGGLLSDITENDEERVNSVHWQGVNEVGEGLIVEATSPDGLVEAISVNDSKSFALGIQFHPEWKVTEIPFYRSIFESFGNACMKENTK